MFERHQGKIILGSVLSLLGLSVIIAGFFSAPNNSKFKKNAVETTATVSSVTKIRESKSSRYKYTVFVKYAADGKEYNEKLLFHEGSEVHEGEQITAMYNPANPRDVRSAAGTVPRNVYLPLFGTLLLLSGCGILGAAVIKEKNIGDLMGRGETVNAEIIEIAVNKKLSINRKNPYNLICRYVHMDGTEYTFKSGNIWRSISEIELEISTRNSKTIPVYVNIAELGSNPQRYYVALEDL